MENHPANTGGVILVGPAGDDFVRRCKVVLGDKQINFTPCPDVYAAVACIAGGPAGLLIVGRLAELSREGGRFFHLAARCGHRCCCLADNNTAAPPHPCTATASDMRQLLKMLETLLAERAASRTEKIKFDKSKFETTEAELKALLGT